jgi:tetratricopeptide (TPR) repeat protein
MFHQRRDWIAAAILFGVTFAVFSRVLTAEIVQWDDDISVSRNVNIQGLDAARLNWMFTDSSYAMRYKPLTWLVYAVVFQLGGLKPFNYHLVSLLLHSLNAVMAFVIVRWLLALSIAKGSVEERLKNSFLPSALAALVWAVHPLRVEVVGRITDVTYELVFFFLMISLWCYLRTHLFGLEQRDRRIWFIGGSVAAYALAMLCYPFAFGWALVLLAIDWYPLRRFDPARSEQRRAILREKVPFLLCGALILPTLLARHNPSVAWAESGAAAALSWGGRAMQALFVWAYYVWKPWFPTRLSPVYTTLVEINPSTGRFWVSGLLVVGISCVVFWRRRQWPWAVALWVGYLVLLLPALGVTEHPHYTSDRYDYIPGLAWALVLAAVLWQISRRPALQMAGAVCVLGLAIVWASLSFHQMRIWQTNLGLFEYMVAQLGDDLRRDDLRRRLGGYYAALGRFEDAARLYQTSLRLAPNVKTFKAAAEMFEKNGNTQAALTNYLGWLQLEADPFAHMRAAANFFLLGDCAQAIVHYRKALALRPDFVPPMERLAWLLATSRDDGCREGTEAVRLAERGRELTHEQNASILGTLAAAYAEVGRFPDALAVAQKACLLAEAGSDVTLKERMRKILDRAQSSRPMRE